MPYTIKSYDAISARRCVPQYGRPCTIPPEYIPRAWPQVRHLIGVASMQSNQSVRPYPSE